MPCYHPLPAWRASSLNPNGKRNIVFKPRDGFRELSIPCSSCIGCRIARAEEWATRCVHEAKMHKESRFVTLTYSPNKLPPGGSLRPRDFVLFMKRLRKKFGNGIRYYQCGEYGTQLQRPHHHALLFGIAFPDELLVRPGERPVYNSVTLDNLWGHGFTSITTVNYSTALYAAKYVIKRITGDKAEGHYQGKVPEYSTMSRRPGLGTSWWKEYAADAFPSDFIIVNGKKRKPPKFYALRFKQENPEAYAQLVKDRKKFAAAHPDNQPRALIRRGDYQETRSEQLRQERSYEK